MLQAERLRACLVEHALGHREPRALMGAGVRDADEIFPSRTAWWYNWAASRSTPRVIIAPMNPPAAAPPAAAATSGPATMSAVAGVPMHRSRRDDASEHRADRAPDGRRADGV